MQQEPSPGSAGRHAPASIPRSESIRAAFDANVKAWEQYTNTPLGRLREALALHYLTQHLGLLPAGASVLDVGGGTGGYALALAELGHQVCLLDFSAPMLALARQKAEDRGQALLERIRFCQASVDDVPSRFAAGQFDLVLCHTLLEYVEDPWATLGNLSLTLCPGGLLSLLFANTYAGPLRWALARGDVERARLSLEQDVSSADLFGLARRTFTVDQMGEALTRVGIEQLATYGVRAFADYMPGDKLADEAFWPRVFELEVNAGVRFPYRDIARYGYVLGRKQAKS
jgi:S-adenosylmethionine-dependent methyltransferase